MSGHSKWSKVKHQKEVTDAVKGKIFTKFANAIAIAVREGGDANPDNNIRLRFIIEKARAANMPKEKIERAVERGTGGNGASQIEEVVYEGFGPEGVGLIIVAATDKKQRTVSLVKNILERGGGALAASGAVSYLFDFVGEVIIEKGSYIFEQIFEWAVTAEALDVQDRGEYVILYSSATNLHKMKGLLEQQGCLVREAELAYRPKDSLPLTPGATAKLHQLLESLEELDDVQRIFTTAKEEEES